MAKMEYQDFLAKKAVVHTQSGFEVKVNSPYLFDWQQIIVEWALKKGKACVFAMTGLGKTAMQLEWAFNVHRELDGNVLILAPIGVVDQTIEEGVKFGIEVNKVASSADVKDGINITNYEKLHKFSASDFAGIVIDESSCLKAHDSHYRQLITDFSSTIDYRLALTATPAPNDFMEFGNHAEFVGAMTRVEMLAMFFTHDGGETSKWRLKGHAQDKFWDWVSTWAIAIRNPSDYGFDGSKYNLPPLNMQDVIVESVNTDETKLFAMEAQGLNEQRAAKKASLSNRIDECIKIVTSTDEKFIIWCELNSEQEILEKLLGDRCVSIKGSTPIDDRPDIERKWRLGDVQILISKSSLYGWGMNWQHCHNMIFVNVSNSFEQQYQAIRRCYRFGQTEIVNVWRILSNAELAIIRNLERKHEQSGEMFSRLTKAMAANFEQTNIDYNKTKYKELEVKGMDWDLRLGDCVEHSKRLADDSIDFVIYSPPFSSMYTYSDSDRDMGNCSGDSEFFTHYKFLLKELYRSLKPGRLTAVHCMNLPTSKERDGYIGIRDFRGDIIRAHQDAGFIYHSEVCIFKDPVTAMQRTKALGLLHKTIRKDSAMSRQGIPDYVCVFRKPGTNPDPIAHTHDEFPVDLWQRYASPIWMDINPSDTLQKESARENGDERHLCPLQKQVIERCLMLWSNPGDLILSPFLGIGSEGYVSLKMNRKFIGFELKESYFNCAVANLRAVTNSNQLSLF